MAITTSEFFGKVGGIAKRTTISTTYYLASLLQCCGHDSACCGYGGDVSRVRYKRRQLMMSLL